MLTVKVVKTDLFNNLQKAVADMNKTVAKVGWFEGAKYPNVSSNAGPAKPIQVASVAVIHEFGYAAKNIPARPFLRPTITSKKTEWASIGVRKSRDIILGNSSVHDLFETIGQKARFDIQKTIKALWSPPLKERTIKARMRKYTSDVDLSVSTRKKRAREVQRFVSAGFYKPLIDTGLMFSSIINVVESE